MEDNEVIICANCYEENKKGQKRCYNCGATLYYNSSKEMEEVDVENIEDIKEKNTIKEQEVKRIYEEKVKTDDYTNSVAKSFKKWSNGVLIIGVITFFICLIATIDLGAAFIIAAFFLLFTFIANALILSAVAEIIQKLQNIEDNTKRKR